MFSSVDRTIWDVMPEKLKKVIGVLLLFMSVFGVSCGSLVNAVSPHTASDGALIERLS